MTRAQLLALSVLVASGIGGAVYFVNRSDAALSTMADSFGALEVVDRSQCSVSACNAAACVQAKNVLSDAGSLCTVGFLSCPVRFGRRARNLADDAGMAYGAALYQQIKVVGARCQVDGGFAYGIPVDDAGWPIFATSVDAFPCAWRPRDAGAAVCTRLDGGDPGLENTMQPGSFTGAGCQPKSCVEIAGESSAP